MKGSGGAGAKKGISKLLESIYRKQPSRVKVQYILFA